MDGVNLIEALLANVKTNVIEYSRSVTIVKDICEKSSKNNACVSYNSVRTEETHVEVIRLVESECHKIQMIERDIYSYLVAQSPVTVVGCIDVVSIEGYGGRMVCLSGLKPMHFVAIAAECNRINLLIKNAIVLVNQARQMLQKGMLQEMKTELAAMHSMLFERGMPFYAFVDKLVNRVEEEPLISMRITTGMVTPKKVNGVKKLYPHIVYQFPVEAGTILRTLSNHGVNPGDSTIYNVSTSVSLAETKKPPHTICGISCVREDGTFVDGIRVYGELGTPAYVWFPGDLCLYVDEY